MREQRHRLALHLHHLKAPEELLRERLCTPAPGKIQFKGAGEEVTQGQT